MSKDYTKEIGYETLLSDFKRYQKQTPRGVGMTKKGQNIYLQFKTPNSARKPYACNCTFTLDGMVDALKKSKLVKEQLEALTSEVEFWAWYDKEIKNESQLVDDRLTFAEAVKVVEDDFWSRPDRRGRKREKGHPSDQSSWNDTYGRFYKHLPRNKLVNLETILEVVSKWKKGTKTYKGVISAMKKLAALSRRKGIYEELASLNVIQTEYRELQNVTLIDFLKWRDKTLGVTASLHKNTHMDIRKAWLWVFSIQVVYGLRIHEVFATANADKPYVTKDNHTIPALNDPENKENILVLQEGTLIGTTTKTGYRLALPNVPPKYPDLIERLEIKKPSIPANKPKSKKPETLINFYNKAARRRLADWEAPTTETHAFRHLANINGMQAGIPLEVRAQSMGHTPAMNDSVYKKRQSTQTTLDLYSSSNTNAIDFVTALGEAKRLIKNDEVDAWLMDTS